MCINCCLYLCDSLSMITTSICCIPCTGVHFQARVTCCSRSEQVHRCSTAIIGCCWNCEAWCCCTIYGRVATCLTNGWCMCIDCCDHLCSCCSITLHNAFPISCTGVHFQARVTCCS